MISDNLQIDQDIIYGLKLAKGTDIFFYLLYGNYQKL